MKKKIIMLGTMLLFVTGFVSAQVCSSYYGGRSFNNARFYSGINSFAASSFALDRLTHSLNSVINEGYHNGSLTDQEINSIESDYRSLERSMRWAYADGRISWHEKSRIESSLRRLNRKIARELRDDDVRVG